MNAVELVDALQSVAKECVRNYVLETNRPDLTKAPQVVAGYLPAKRPKDQPDAVPDLPYVIVRLLRGEDQGNGSTATVKILIGTHSEAEQDGWRDAANIIERIRIELLKHRTVARRFRLELPLTYELPEEQPYPEWVGWLETRWALAQPQEEVQYEQE